MRLTAEDHARKDNASSRGTFDQHVEVISVYEAPLFVKVHSDDVMVRSIEPPNVCMTAAIRTVRPMERGGRDGTRSNRLYYGLP